MPRVHPLPEGEVEEKYEDDLNAQKSDSGDAWKSEEFIEGKSTVTEDEVISEQPEDTATNNSFCAKLSSMWCSVTNDPMSIVEEKYGITARRAKKLRMAFRSLDENGNGVISREELVVGMQTHTSCFEGDDEAIEAAMLADTDGNGMLDYEEFVVWIITVAVMQSNSNTKRPDPLLQIARQCGFE